MGLEKLTNNLIACFAIFGLTFIEACLPKGRIGSYPSPAIGTKFLGRDLGQHEYWLGLSEKNGIVYTCKAGHIDIAHSRKVIDWTAFLKSKIYKNLMKNKAKFSFKLMEPSLYHVELNYPFNWEDLSETDKRAMAEDVSIQLGAYFAYTAATWHEILTWFGYKSWGIVPEYPSAFSWEDSFSNAFGSYIGVIALRDKEHSFDQSVTLALDRELERLEIQPKETARNAAKKVKGKWFEERFFPSMKKRNFDIGLDGYVAPWIIFSQECEKEDIWPCPIPNLNSLSKHGFSMNLEIEPKEAERKRILESVYGRNGEKKLICPAIHFGGIIGCVKKDAERKYGPYVNIPYTFDEKTENNIK